MNNNNRLPTGCYKNHLVRDFVHLGVSQSPMFVQTYQRNHNDFISLSKQRFSSKAENKKQLR